MKIQAKKGFIEVDLAPHWDTLQDFAKRRHEYKKHYNSTNIMTDNYALLGAAGEMTYAICVGMKPDLRLFVGGDNGHDFIDVDVKAGNEKARYLIEFRHKTFRRKYAFCKIDTEARKGKYMGWITGAAFTIHGQVKNFGHGDRYALPLEKLSSPYTDRMVVRNALRTRTMYDNIILFAAGYNSRQAS